MAVSLILLTLIVVRLSNVVAQESRRPNFIILQPDDLRFQERWNPPPHHPNNPQITRIPSAQSMPNVERLREGGLQMMQAYTTSPMCGTSRYSTMTGRYPSRSSFGRDMNTPQEDITFVDIPYVKLTNEGSVNGGQDCRENNMAAILKTNGYQTGMVGKWHLTPTDGSYSYSGIQNTIRSCGFDFVESVYPENQWGDWHDGSFSHNMEYMTVEGINFIKSAASSQDPFFLYFNPTVPHDSADVLEALTEFDCRDTPGGRISEEPVIKGMTEGSNCERYRETVLERAGGTMSNNNLGGIWLDDAIGALLQALEDTNQLDNTFFLFQLDHGQEGKRTIYETGVRITQFVHFPNAIAAGTTFEGVVSTVDIAKTVLDYAGIDELSPGYYDMDGISWRQVIESGSNDAETSWQERCLFFELDYDRAVRCGCFKYMALDQQWSNTWDRGQTAGLYVNDEILFDLCDNEIYEDGDDNKETQNVRNSNLDTFQELRSFTECHLQRTSADQVQNYEACGVTPPLLLQTTSEPTARPTPVPPTPAPQIVATPSPTKSCIGFNQDCTSDGDCCSSLVCYKLASQTSSNGNCRSQGGGTMSMSNLSDGRGGAGGQSM